MESPRARFKRQFVYDDLLLTSYCILSDFHEYFYLCRSISRGYGTRPHRQQVKLRSGSPDSIDGCFVCGAPKGG